MGRSRTGRNRRGKVGHEVVVLDRVSGPECTGVKYLADGCQGRSAFNQASVAKRERANVPSGCVLADSCSMG
jgi:hypothetical protein